MSACSATWPVTREHERPEKKTSLDEETAGRDHRIVAKLSVEPPKLGEKPSEVAQRFPSRQRTQPAFGATEVSEERPTDRPSANDRPTEPPLAAETSERPTAPPPPGFELTRSTLPPPLPEVAPARVHERGDRKLLSDSDGKPCEFAVAQDPFTVAAALDEHLAWLPEDQRPEVFEALLCGEYDRVLTMFRRARVQYPRVVTIAKAIETVEGALASQLLARIGSRSDEVVVHTSAARLDDSSRSTILRLARMCATLGEILDRNPLPRVEALRILVGLCADGTLTLRSAAEVEAHIPTESGERFRVDRIGFPSSAKRPATR